MSRKQKLLYEFIDDEILYEKGIHSAYEKYCGNLTLEDIFTTDSVYLAAKQCASGFQSRGDTQAFMRGAWLHSKDLCERVLAGKFVPKYYPVKIINERGKMRTIRPPHFECKVVQKVLCNVILRAVLEYRMIYTNYASIRGKGTQKLYNDVLAGLNRAKHIYEDPVIVMSDYTNFFGSINNDMLERDVFERYIKDRRITKLLRSFSPEPYGLSLGNEVSQIPASFYPSPVDHWVKDKLGLKCYFRYADDILFVSERKDAAGILADIRRISSGLDLTIKDEKVKVVEYGTNFIYCKERYIYNKEKGYYYNLINPAIPRRQAHKIRAFSRMVAEGKIDRKEADNIQKCVLGVIGSHPNSRKTVARLNGLYTSLMPSNTTTAPRPNQQS